MSAILCIALCLTDDFVTRSASSLFPPCITRGTVEYSSVVCTALHRTALHLMTDLPHRKTLPNVGMLSLLVLLLDMSGKHQPNNVCDTKKCPSPARPDLRTCILPGAMSASSETRSLPRRTSNRTSAPAAEVESGGTPAPLTG